MERQEARARIEGGFWFFYQSLVRDRVIPYQWRAMNDEIPGAPKSHSVENFRIAAGRSRGSHEGMVFQDSDLAKWLEAAGNVLSEPGSDNAQLRAWAEEAVDLVAAAQQPDGYVNTYFTVKEPGRRWGNLRDAHELYCSGHLIEAGVAMAGAPGGLKLLGVVKRLADLVDASFGRENGKLRAYPGHEEVELALVRLYRLTGDRRYLTRARYFVDERGRRPSYFEEEAARPDFVSLFGAKPLEYYQAHEPVRQQREAVGHAVRAMYLYTAMADLALEMNDASLAEACDRLWDNTTQRKMYVTGGVGSSAAWESFGPDFDLPNDTAYAETCAAIGLLLFSSRMLRLRNDARYADVMERCLYNGIISGISLDGESYFYVNPLEVVPAVCDHNASYHLVKYRRQPWYGCACCPPNLARTLSAVGHLAYHHDGDTLYADLFHEGTLSTEIAGVIVTVRQSTAYPWEESVTLTLTTDRSVEFTLAVRAPAWCRAPMLAVNGKRVPSERGSDGYIRVRRTWNRGDRVELSLPMPVERVHADTRVRATFGKVALQRGPVVYCVEEADNGPDLYRVRLPRSARVEAVRRPDLLGGVVAISAAGERAAAGEPGVPPRWEERPLLFVPYYAWANRAPGEMTVWVRE